jgi:hypothetical protein
MPSDLMFHGKEEEEDSHFSAVSDRFMVSNQWLIYCIKTHMGDTC